MKRHLRESNKWKKWLATINSTNVKTQLFSKAFGHVSSTKMSTAREKKHEVQRAVRKAT